METFTRNLILVLGGENHQDMKLKMKNPFLRGSRKLSPTSAAAAASTTSTASAATSVSITGSCLACFAPLVRRNSTIFHYASVPLESMVEEIERLQLETSIDDLPDPLLVDIFQRLPINSVFRTKCVSKRWLSLISDPLFAQSYVHRQQYISRPFALFYISFIPESEDPCEIGPYCPPFQPESFTFPLNFFTNELQKTQKEACSLQLMGSNSDLLLFSLQPSIDSYSVCNPLTFQWVTLPQPPKRRARYPVVGFMVEDDGTFRVVQISPTKLHSSRALIFLVFCSQTGKWCSKQVACPREFESFWAKTTLVYKGNIIWMVNNGFLAFDPKNDTDQCCFLDLPSDQMGRFGVSCGGLYYYEVSSYEPLEANENPILSVWTMVNFEGGEWVLLHSIRYEHLWSRDESLQEFLSLPNGEKYFQWVSFHPVDSDIVFLKCDGQLVTCKISSACLEVLPCDSKQGTFCRLEWDVVPLVFRPWPTAVAISYETGQASTSYVHGL